MTPAARAVTAQLLPWSLAASVAVLATTHLTTGFVALTTGQRFAEVMSIPAASHGALIACGVVIAIGLWLRFSAWLTAGVLRKDMVAALTTVTAVDTLVILVLSGLVAVAAGQGVDGGEFLHLALAAIAVHVGAILTVVSFLAIGRWRSALLLVLTVPVVPWVADLFGSALPEHLPLLVLIVWLAPALLVTPFLVHRMPAPSQVL